MDKLKLLILALASILFSCSKTSGTGGRSTIKGIIMVKNINILVISTSEIRISVLIEEKNAELAVKTLHNVFELA